MAYLGLSLDYPAQYLTDVPPPGDPDHCARYCAWLASKKAGSLSMDYMERPPGCTCPDEVAPGRKPGPYDPFYDSYPMTLPAPLPSPGSIQLTPQQIEAQVKQIQPAQGGGLVLAAIAALLILGA